MATDVVQLSSLPEEAERSAPAQPRRYALVVAAAVACSGLAAAASLALHNHGLGRMGLVELLLLAGFLVAVERFGHEVFGDIATSAGLVPVVAAGVLVGPFAAIALALAATVGVDLARRNVRLVSAFNAATTTAAALAATAIVDAAATGGNDWAVLGGSILAGVAFWAVSMLFLASGHAAWEGESTVGILRASGLWLVPHFGVHGALVGGLVLAEGALGPMGIVVFAMPVLAMGLVTLQYVRRTEGDVAGLREANRTLERLLAENRGLVASLGRQHFATIRGLVRAIDAKDPYTAGHTERVAAYSVLLAEALGMDEVVCRQVEHGALLHDIGKIGVSDRILGKPGPLDDDEWREIRRHPEIACFILDGIDLPAVVMSTIRSHHENLDGSGYPDGLGGDDLSVAARIARVADAFDAMTSSRPYRTGLTVQAARAELRGNVGSQFCPEVVAAMEELIERGALAPVLQRRPAAPLLRVSA